MNFEYIKPSLPYYIKQPILIEAQKIDRYNLYGIKLTCYFPKNLIKLIRNELYCDINGKKCYNGYFSEVNEEMAYTTFILTESLSYDEYIELGRSGKFRVTHWRIDNKE